MLKAGTHHVLAITWTLTLFADCRLKIHREHLEKGEEIPVCKVSFESHTAKEMLLLAPSTDSQKVRVLCSSVIR